MYGALLTIGLVGLIFYNKWNYRRMKEEREAMDECLAELYEAGKARESLQSWGSSFFEDDDSSLGLGESEISISRVDTSAGGMRGCLRGSMQTVSTLSVSTLGECDLADERHFWHEGSISSATLPVSHHEDGGRRKSSLESIESWEA